MRFKSLKVRNKTIGVKLSLWYAGFFVLSVCVLFGLAFIFLQETLERDDREAIQAQIEEVTRIYAKGGMESVENELKAGKKYRKRSPFFFRFAAGDNTTRRVFFPGQWEEFRVPRLQIVDPASREWIRVPTESDDAGYRLEVASARLPDGSWLQVGMSTEERQRVLSRFLESFLYLVGFLLLTGLAGGYYLSHRALRPIRHLIQTMRSVESGRMDARVPHSGANDELGELVRIFNRMLSRIEALVEGMKSSLDQVAHDLRTPMTRMQNIAESALRYGKDPEQYKRALQDFVEESERILKMLNTLMDISEAETGVMHLDIQPVRVGEVIDTVTEVYGYVAEEKGLAIEARGDGDIWVQADYNRLSQALANLLDNAIKYTPSHSAPVIVQAWETEGEVVLSVSDHGEGIEALELYRIWDRLYRGGKGSDRTDKGLGLGLAQVRAIVWAHKGWVDVSSQEGHGSTFKLHLPRRN
jgi:signal transduction histidine kinase